MKKSFEQNITKTTKHVGNEPVSSHATSEIQDKQNDEQMSYNKLR